MFIKTCGNIGLCEQDTSGNPAGEEQGQSNVKVFCRMCNRVENEGSERAKKMLSCKSCGKKYHRNCLRSWAQNRGKKVYLCACIIWSKCHMFSFLGSFSADLFHWSSWTCRACRICEVISDV